MAVDMTANFFINETPCYSSNTSLSLSLLGSRLTKHRKERIVSQENKDKADAAEARTRQTKGFMQQVTPRQVLVHVDSPLGVPLRPELGEPQGYALNGGLESGGIG